MHGNSNCARDDTGLVPSDVTRVVSGDVTQFHSILHFWLSFIPPKTISISNLTQEHVESLVCAQVFSF